MNCLVMAPMMNKPPILLTSPVMRDDGVTHINVHYDDASTPLGRMLSSYYVQRFEHPVLGPFRCVEGFMLFLRTGAWDDHFRSLTGSQAKAYYREQIKDSRLANYDVPQEERIFLSAMYYRLIQHSVTAQRFTDSTLPFDNYFLWAKDKKKTPREKRLPIRPDDAEDVIRSLTTLRDLMRAGQAPVDLSEEEYAVLRKT